MNRMRPRVDRLCRGLGVLAAILAGVGGIRASVDLSRLPPPVDRPVDFARDVRPILEASCFSCHGPEKQKSGYRLDVRESALTGGEGSAPNVIPGKSAASPLIHYVSDLVEDMLMPSKGDSLTPEQIGVLRAWIDQGASWPDDGASDPLTESWKRHWSFQPMARPAVPAAPDGRARQPVDAFIETKLAEKGLTLSPEADRRTLIRRLTFDLTGLPPTPEEVADFVNDPSPKAYEQRVERLLASPRYGERWGRHWLDVVRFAESDGFERNNLRPNAWPYRDYVIRAFNEDLPYARFVREQIAGDALGADAATGFLVGGAFDMLQSFEPPEFNSVQRADELHDMVNAVSSSFLGLTVACARCHDHKFDPISQRDYYSLTAILQGVEHGERALRPENATEREREAAKPRARLAAIDAAFAPFASHPRLRESRAVGLAPADPARPSELKLYTAGSEAGQAEDRGHEARFPTLSEGCRVWSLADPKDAAAPLSPWEPLPSGRYRVWLSWGVATDHATRAEYLLDRDGLVETSEDRTVIAHVNQTTFASGGAAVAGETRWSGFVSAGVHDLTAQSRLLVRKEKTPGVLSADLLVVEAMASGENPPETMMPHLRAPVSVKANHETFAPMDAKFVRFTVLASNSPEAYLDELEVFTTGDSPRNVALAENDAVATAPLVNGHNGNPFYLNDGRFNERACWNSPANVHGAVQIEFARVERVDHIVWSRNRSDRQPKLDDNLATGYRIELSVDGTSWTTVASSQDRLSQPYRKRVPTLSTLSGVPLARAAEVSRLADERRGWAAKLRELTDYPPVYAGKLRQPGPSFRLHRGSPLSRREQVPPATLARFGAKRVLPVDTPEQQRRLALADWLVDPEHPLTARVMVNRIWHYHFGSGLVDTPSDFGINGSRPTHPELLDWLARTFIERGWRVKELHRLILLSKTYRQASLQTPRAQEIDAGARLLWRFPAQRMEAEALRDSMLAVAGLLNPRRGGPGFQLFDTYLTKSNVHMYPSRSEFGPEEFRRMVYQCKPRVQLDDVFGAFDCPDAGQITPKRNRSTTPLQAFNLLNSPFALQMAAAFAARLEREAGPDPEAQVRRAFDLALGRPPEAAELSAAATVVREHGLKVLCRTVFNLNEFIHIP
ncbi:MAG: DUF1553 domain-containing protein [Opitutaceae bacterium]|nr:DUF1553 domain-containing protein [Opitutaceae bacterium]